jgi:hypothetical protein
MGTRGFEITTGLVIQQGLFEISSVAKHDLGTRMQLADGRVFYYALSGGTATAGKPLTPTIQATPANYLNMAVTAAAAIGDTKVSITNGGDVLVADEFAGGFLGVYTTGEQYKVSHHAAVAGGAGVDIYLHDPLRVAMTTASKVNLSGSPYWKVKNYTAVTDFIVGVPTVSITSGYYGWVQTWGPCNILNSVALDNGEVAGLAAAGAGTVKWATAADAVLHTTPMIGHGYEITSVTTKYSPFFLKINP